MESAVARAVVAVAVVAALGASAACGSGGDDGGGGDGRGGDGGGGRRPSQGHSGPGTTALERAALTAADLKGYRVERPDAGGGAGAGPAAPPAGAPAPAACAPLADPGRAESPVTRVLTPTADKDLTTTDVALSAHTTAGAKRIIADLRAAADAEECAAFRMGEYRYLGVERTRAPDRGDEAVSYRLGLRRGAYVLRKGVTVVRTGSAVAVFDASNLYDPEGVQNDRQAVQDGLGSTGTPTADQDPEVAAGIVDAQLGKLRPGTT
ncbi:hypothetical protein [Streptomyces sp. NPDC047123]|uniref:hypothetical protein n=1 Tax=Streptomyces sp. NPDC047123 TaxID=3155622 RepID=UPI0033C5227C